MKERGWRKEMGKGGAEGRWRKLPGVMRSHS